MYTQQLIQIGAQRSERSQRDAAVKRPTSLMPQVLLPYAGPCAHDLGGLASRADRVESFQACT